MTRAPSRSWGAARRAALAALALSASACSSGEASPYFGATERVGKSEDTFYAKIGSEPEYLDPGKSGDTVSATLIVQLFEGLTSDDPRDGHPVQGVALRWDVSSDNRLFRFYLRPDARWSDGKPVTAHDFAYAWRRVLRPATASQSATNLYPLKNAELFNQGKLQVTVRERPLRTEPRPDAPERARLPKGTAVQILGRSQQGEKAWVLVERYQKLPTFAPLPRSPRSPPEPLLEPTGYLEEEELLEDTGVLGVRATSDLILDVELEQPTPYFTGLTSYPTLFPVREDVVTAFERRGEGDLWVRPGNIVSNGPFVLDEWKFRYEITMKQNPAYWNRDKLKIRRIVWLEVDQTHTAMQLYKSGEIDFAGDDDAPPSEYLSLLAGKKDFLSNRYLQVEWYEFNTRKPPVDDVRVRRALNLAVDKAEIVEKVIHGGRLPATHYVPEYTGLGYSALMSAEKAAGTSPFVGPDVEFNPSRARELMKEAGYEVVKDGNGYLARGFPALELLYNSNEVLKQVAVAVQDMWKRNLGVSVRLRSEDWKVLLKSYREGQFQVIRLAWTADYDHPHTFLDTFRGSNPQNQSGWNDNTYEETMKEAAATAEQGKSIALYRKAEAIALSAMPRLPLYFDTRPTLLKPWVKGFWSSSLHPHLVQYFWIDPAWRLERGNEPAFLPDEFPAPGRVP
jgi:oligopeptide transport system substrate-binding protein